MSACSACQALRFTETVKPGSQAEVQRDWSQSVQRQLITSIRNHFRGCRDGWHRYCS